MRVVRSPMDALTASMGFLTPCNIKEVGVADPKLHITMTTILDQL